MSGIYGIYRNPLMKDIKNCREEIPELRTSMRALKKWNLAYGEDTCGENFCDENWGMGICVEHITSSPINPSPILMKDDKTYAVIDGIIYNRDEILSKYHLSGALSDEEILFECFTNYGGSALAEINGDYCGAIFNKETGALTLIRDHMGVRPLFVYTHDSWIAFSSDLRGLLALPGITSKVDEDWLYRAVCGYDTADYVKTEIEKISFVKPASYVVFEPQDATLFHSEENVYWMIGTKRIHLASREAYQEKLRELITDAVKKRAAVFPGKVGAELSGGLDSGVISILLSRLKKEGIYYSWSFSPEDLPFAPNDERLVIADICEQEHITCNYGTMVMDLSPESNLGKKHVRIGLVPDPEMSAEYNYALPPYINTTIISETAQYIREAGGRVVFSGHSGDEGVSHRCDPYEMYYNGEYWHFFMHMWYQTKGRKLHLLRALQQCYRKVKIGKRHQHTPFNTGDGAPEILSQSFLDKYKEHTMPPLTFAFDTISYIYSGNTHNRLDVAALLGAYAGARYVFPFVDYRVIDFAVSIPRYLYLYKDMNRYIYRQAFKSMMPDSLYTCTAKDNPSTANLKSKEEENEDWFVSFDRSRKTVLAKLNRPYWEDYLNFDFLDQWSTSPKPIEEEKLHNYHILKQLLLCLRFQTMCEQAKCVNLD